MDYQPYFPFIKNLTPDQSAQMLASLRHLSFLKGESLHDGQQCTGLFAVEDRTAPRLHSLCRGQRNHSLSSGAL